MNFLLTYAHPNPESFNHALFRTTREVIEAAGHSVRVHDLYALQFDPVLQSADFEAINKGGARPDVAALQDDIRWADRLFMTYPIWWYSRPAILQGYIDRVFARGFAYGEVAGKKGGLTQDKALVFQTTGSPESSYGEDGKLALHMPMREGTLQYFGISDVEIHTFYAVTGNSGEKQQDRQQMLDEAAKIVQKFAS